VHGSSLLLVEHALATYCLDRPHPAIVLDVGSLDVNGTYKHLFAGDDYIGCDLVGGPNVTVVLDPDKPYKMPFEACQFDLVVCGQVLEHSPMPWLIVQEMKRVLKPGGYIILVAPSAGPRHFTPDCWRLTDAGMRGLADWAGLWIVYCETVDALPWNDTIAVMVKR